MQKVVSFKAESLFRLSEEISEYIKENSMHVDNVAIINGYEYEALVTVHKIHTDCF
ncbi:MAG: hypothetical protein ACRC1P_09630 [Cellulosilyticaceae bacterium]